MPAIKIIFLGTNGWYDSKTGNTVSVLIETPYENIVLDAGNGIHKIDKYIKNNKPIYLFLSHYHLDHIIGLHTLAKFNFSQAINIYGPRGLKKYLNKIINKPYTVPLSKLKVKIKLHELKNKCHLPLNMEFKPLKHPVLCLGYRFLLGEKIITYCTDTGLCKNLYHLARETDLLIGECSLKPGHVNNKWPHLNPESVASVAKNSAAKKLVLIHFDASNYSTFKYRKDAENKARAIFNNTMAIKDDDCIKL
jgi:ribonuclease BN (tRNA processing enzyme)